MLKKDISQELQSYCREYFFSQDKNSKLYNIRLGAYELFKINGLPNSKDENWKYTNISQKIDTIPEYSNNLPVPLNINNFINNFDIMKKLKETNDTVLVFMDGSLQRQLSIIDPNKKNIEISSLNEDVPDWALEIISDKHSENSDQVFDINTILMQDGALINIKQNKEKVDNVYIVHVGNNNGFFNYRHVINIEQGARANIIELKISNRVDINALYTSSIIWKLADNCIVNNVKYQSHNQLTVGFNQQYADIGNNVEFNSFTISSGSKLLREYRSINCNGSGSDVSISGINLLDGDSHIDTFLLVKHIAPNTTSREKYKSILNDRSRGVFQGNIIVDPEAQKTLAKQSIDALILSDKAEHDAKPELEIYADDVQCGHGATTGQISEDSLFYLKSRGIPEEEAKTLLVQAFLLEALDEVKDKNTILIFSDVMKNILNRVSKGSLNV
jgi:Fe-S cluster assembly protein SufD